MKVTNVTVSVKAVEGNIVKGYASILFDNCFAVKNIRIVKRDKGYLIAMPSRKIGEQFDDIAFPINKETRKMIEDKVMHKFYEEVTSILGNLKITEGYDLKYNVDNIHDIALVKLSTNKIIDTYDLEDYTTESLEELEKEVNEKIEGLHE